MRFVEGLLNTMSRVNAGSLKLLNAMLGRLVKRGSLTLIDAEGVYHTHGDGGEPKAVIRIDDPAIYSALFTNPELAAGEAYMDGKLTYESGSIGDLLNVFHTNSKNLRTAPVRKTLARGVKMIRRAHQHNPCLLYTSPSPRDS